MKNIELSIIIPVYNASNYLRKLICSLKQINHNNIQIIFVDDGSIDGSAEILDEIQSENILVFHQNNGGAPSARNYGLTVARGRYILFFDADDTLNVDIFGKCFEKIQDQEPELLVSGYNIIDMQDKMIGTVTTRNVKYAMGKKNRRLYTYLISPYPGNKIYKKSIIDHYGITFDDVKIGQDLNFYLKYLAVVDNILFFEKSLSNYRISDGSISVSYDKRITDIEKSLQLVRRFYMNNDLSSQLHFWRYVCYAHLTTQYSKIIHYEDHELQRNLKQHFETRIQYFESQIKITSLYEILKFKKIKHVYLTEKERLNCYLRKA